MLPSFLDCVANMICQYEWAVAVAVAWCDAEMVNQYVKGQMGVKLFIDWDWKWNYEIDVCLPNCSSNHHFHPHPHPKYLTFLTAQFISTYSLFE